MTDYYEEHPLKSLVGLIYEDEIDRLKKRNEELEKALRQCYNAIEVAFDYDADVFGIHHNDAVDAIMEAERLLEIK